MKNFYANQARNNFMYEHANRVKKQNNDENKFSLEELKELKGEAGNLFFIDMSNIICNSMENGIQRGV